MAVDLDASPPVLSPGAGPQSMRGYTFPVAIPTTAADQIVLSRDCWLMGWSLREATGLAGAIAELFDGGSNNGNPLGMIDLTAGTDPSASQTPAQATAQGAASAIAPSFGGAAGTQAFIESLRIAGTGATAGSVIQAVLNGVAGGAITYEVTIPAGAGVAVVPVVDNFGGRGLPASALGQAITLNVPSFGAGNLFSEAEIQGYIQAVAGASDTQWFGGEGIYCKGGIFLHLVTGSVRGAIWVAI